MEDLPRNEYDTRDIPFRGDRTMWTRRSFLEGTGLASAGALALEWSSVDDVLAASAAVAEKSPDEVAQDEFYWREIQQAFTLDRTLINFNNGNNCPSPRVVH